MEKLGDGAEAIIYSEGSVVIKDRIPKGYRIPEIDERLRKGRTRKEAKLMEKVQKLGFGPRLISSDEKTTRLGMEFLEGRKVRDILDKKNFRRICREMGEKIAELHNQNIVHSDLTTSNMILGKRLYLIDFGLSFESHKIEDKAVDLHLLRQALESKHHEIYNQAFREVLSAYSRRARDAGEILKRLELVEKRGRNKGKIS